MALPVPSARQLVDFLVITTRTPDFAICPAMLEKKLFTGFFGWEKSIQFTQLDHTLKFSISGIFCQVSDNSLCNPVEIRTVTHVHVIAWHKDHLESQSMREVHIRNALLQDGAGIRWWARLNPKTSVGSE
jgi:hypothetical protein